MALYESSKSKLTTNDTYTQVSDIACRAALSIYINASNNSIDKVSYHTPDHMSTIK